MKIDESLKTIKDVLKKCQNVRVSEPFVKELKKLYKDEEHAVFLAEFCRLLEFALAEIVEPYVTRILNVTSKFALSLMSKRRVKPENPKSQQAGQDDDETHMHPFLQDLFYFLLKMLIAASYKVRRNTLRLISSLFTDPHMICSDKPLFQKLHSHLSYRLRDTIAAVRAEAVLCAYVLQDMDNENCPVVKALLHLMSKDTYHVTRQNVVANILVSPNTLPALRERLRDISSSVRKAALSRISKHVSIHIFTVEQRIEILECCFDDSSNAMMTVLNTKLLPAWLSECNGDVLKLLSLLDVKSYPEVCQQVLDVIFQMGDINDMIPALKLNPETHLMEIPELSAASAFLWKSLWLYMKHSETFLSSNAHKFLVPTVSSFCGYFEKFIGTRENFEIVSDDKAFIFEQLLMLAVELDMEDISELEMLGTLILDILKSERYTLVTIKPLVSSLKSVKDNASFITDILSVSTTLSSKIPTHQDQYTVPNHVANIQLCLRILIEFLKVVVSKQLTDASKQFTELKDLMRIFVYPAITHPLCPVQTEAIECLALYCLTNADEASKYLSDIIEASKSETSSIHIIALKALFDILLYHDPRSLLYPVSDTSDAEDNIVEDVAYDFATLCDDTLLPHLLSQTPEIRTLAAEGLAKLLMKGSISCPMVLSGLLSMYYHRDYKSDQHLQQFLSNFLEEYVKLRANLECVKGAFCTTLHAVQTLLSWSYLTDEELIEIVADMLEIADSVPSVEDKGNEVHSAFVLPICNIILENPKSQDVGKAVSLLRKLKFTPLETPDVLNTVEKLLKVMKYKTHLKVVEEVIKRVKYAMAAFEDNASSQDTIVNDSMEQLSIE